MEKLTPEIEAKGLKAYEQVCAFEELRRRKLPLIYGAFTVMQAAFGVEMLRYNQPNLVAVFLVCAVGFGIWSGLNWRKQKEHYARNLKLVTEMEKTYGDELQWVKIEKHFAQLAKLQRELAMEERAKGE